MSLAGGLPVIAKGRAPQSIGGTDGKVIALELRSLGGLKPMPLGDHVHLLRQPLPFSNVKRAHFLTDTDRDEFVAGLVVLDPSAAALVTDTKAVQSLGEWPAVPAGTDVVGWGTSWSRQLAVQERISAALLVGAAAAGHEAWSDPTIEAVRTGDFSGAQAGLHELASCLARLDEIAGWTGQQLAQALEAAGSPVGSRLARFADAFLAAQDPFGAAVPPEAEGPVETALAGLLAVAGLSTQESPWFVLESMRESGTPLTAAIAGLAYTRILLPRALRPMGRDTSLVKEEIAAAKLRVSARSRRPATTKRSRSPRADAGDPGLVLGL